MVRQKIILLILFLFSLSSSFGQQIPEGYYNNIDGKQNREIKTQLHKILKVHTRLKYNDLWFYFRTTDVKDNGTVWDMYSNTVRNFNPNGGNSSTSGMHKEHSLPKSWWGTSSEVESFDAYTDLNHLYPSDGDANTAKSNYMLGEINSTTFNNGVSKVGRNAYSYPGSSTANAFEPADEYKGDFARTYFYMITCYEDYAQQWRSDGLNMLNQEVYPVLKDWAKDMLLKWHRNDPVSAKEIIRNEEVYLYQSNRNPFIDFPQLVEYIWGDSTNYVFSLPEDLKSGDPVLITPPNLTEVYFGDIHKNSEVAQTVTFKGSSLTGNLSVMLWGPDQKYFSIPTKTIPSALANGAGYEFSITYNPTEYGEHSASIIISDGGLAGSIQVFLRGICSEGSPIIPIGSNDPDIYTDGKEIVFRTYEANTEVNIYNSLGRCVYSGQGTADWQRFSTSKPGVYLVSLNDKCCKVVTIKD
ncbi:endonuclease [Bacteroidales bacterium OttesenSCG-928-M11]|nr:endonuclease [Bacteroidales bacterium OttesenSCG-928-M11]